MNYEIMGQDTADRDTPRGYPARGYLVPEDNLTLEHARRKGIHDAASDVVRITSLALVAVAVFTILPDKWIEKGKKQVKGFLP